MSLDLVVVNYRTYDDLARFQASVDHYAPKTESTLTVVDVGTTGSETVETEGKLPHRFEWGPGHPGELIDIGENIGYARSCNFAAARGTGNYIGFFNADVELTEGAIDACVDAFDTNPDWAILGPRQIDRQRRLRHAGIFGTHRAPRHRGWNETDRGQYTDVADAITVSGSAYFIRRSVWEELTSCPLYQEIAPHAEGAFLPTSHYYEETWCSYHAAAHDHRVVYLGTVTLVHQWHQASPVGGWAEAQVPKSQEYFRAACDHHGLEHD